MILGLMFLQVPVLALVEYFRSPSNLHPSKIIFIKLGLHLYIYITVISFCLFIWLDVRS